MCKIQPHYGGSKFKSVKSQSEVIFDEERNACISRLQAQDKEEDRLGLKSNESRGVEYLEEDQLEADEIRDQHTTSGTGDGDNRGCTDETTSGTGDDNRRRTDKTTSGTDGDICGRTNETASGTGGRANGSGHTIEDSRPNGAANEPGPH